MTLCYKYLIRPMGFSLRQANLFMCKVWAISRSRRAIGIISRYWKSGYLLRSYPPAWQAPYAIILLPSFLPLQREPHGPITGDLAII